MLHHDKRKNQRHVRMQTLDVKLVEGSNLGGLDRPVGRRLGDLNLFVEVVRLGRSVLVSERNSGGVFWPVS